MSEIHNLPDTGSDYKSDDRIAVDVETFAGSGVWVTKYINKDNFLQFAGLVLKVSVPSAQVLTSGVTPVTMLAGIASNLIIPDWVIGKLSFATLPYGTNVDVAIKHSSLGVDIFEKVGFLALGADAYLFFEKIDDLASGVQFAASNELVFYTRGGNPLLGNSDIDLYFKYSAFAQ